jgi:hypothetical protein
VIAKVSRGLGEAMVGINVPPPRAGAAFAPDGPQPDRLAERGW